MKGTVERRGNEWYFVTRGWGRVFAYRISAMHSPGNLPPEAGEGELAGVWNGNNAKVFQGDVIVGEFPSDMPSEVL